MFPFAPSIEPYKSAQTFIPEDPMIMIEQAWSDQVPVIFSNCSNEGLMIHKETLKDPFLITNLKDRFHDMVPLDLGGNERESQTSKQMGAALKKFYFGYTEPEMANIGAFEDVRYSVRLIRNCNILTKFIFQLMADQQFNYGTYRAIKMRIAKANTADTYLLRFDFDSNVMNFMRYMFAGRKSRGTCHADDCNFIFKTCITPKLSHSTPEFKTIDRFVIL